MSFTSCNKKISEIELTPENFEKFYEINFYNDDVVLKNSNYGIYGDRYSTNLILEIKPKRVPGKFKLVDAKLSISLKANYDYPNSNWKMSSSNEISGDVIYDSEWGNMDMMVTTLK